MEITEKAPILEPMRLAKKVRISAGLTPWAMSKRVGRKSIQSYLSFERAAKKLSLKDFYALERIWLEEKCGTKDEFDKLARTLAEKS